MIIAIAVLWIVLVVLIYVSGYQDGKHMAEARLQMEEAERDLVDLEIEYGLRGNP